MRMIIVVRQYKFRYSVKLRSGECIGNLNLHEIGFSDNIFNDL